MPATLPGPRPPDSAARLWARLAGFAAMEERLGTWAMTPGPVAAGLHEFPRFGVKQGWACLFGGAMCGLLIVTCLALMADIDVAAPGPTSPPAVAGPLSAGTFSE